MKTKSKTSKTIQTLTQEAKTHIQQHGVQKVQKGKEKIAAFIVSDGGWLLNWFEKIFKEGKSVLNDVMYGVENYDDWSELRGKFRLTDAGEILVVPHCQKRSDGIRQIVALIRCVLVALEPYFPKETK